MTINTATQANPSDCKPALRIRRAVGAEGRGYRLATPYRHPEFVAAFKALVCSAWHKKAGEWGIPESKLSVAVELVEFWFGVRVIVEGAAPAVPPLPPASTRKPFVPARLEQTYYVCPRTRQRIPATRIEGWDV